MRIASSRIVCVTSLFLLWAMPAATEGAAPNSLILNEANAVSGGNYLGGARHDTSLGRLQGNGQNWMEFLVVIPDPGKHTLDLRGFVLDWLFEKDDGTASGFGTMTFSQDPLWSAVPRGTMITISEWQQAWYLTNTPAYPGNPDGDPLGAGGLQRAGGINGFGGQSGSAYNPDPDVHTLRDFSTDTYWHPASQSGTDWNIHVWAGEKDGQNEFRYFSFDGEVTEDDVVYEVGVDQTAGLFAVNNDDWQISIRDNLGNPIQAAIGENAPGWAGGGVNSGENVKLEKFAASENPTLADYMGVSVANYRDGSSSSFGGANQCTT